MTRQGALLRAVVAGSVGLLPATRTKNRLLRLLGHRVHRTARVSPILLLGVERLVLGPGAVIGAGTTFRNLRRIELHTGAVIGGWNSISASPLYRTPGVSADEDVAGAIVLGEGAFITNRHYLDCSGGLILGRWAGMGGVHTVVLSHSIDLGDYTTWCGTVRFEDHSFVATATRILAGSTLPARSVLAAGAVLLPGLTEPDAMYGGVPARMIRKDVSNGRWFVRAGDIDLHRGLPSATPPDEGGTGTLGAN